MGAEADDDGLPVSLEGLPAAHLRVLLDGLPVFERYGLLLAGGYAFRAHEILRRPSQDLDFATRDDTPLPEIAGHVRNAFQAAGYQVELVEATGRYARLTLQRGQAELRSKAKRSSDKRPGDLLLLTAPLVPMVCT